MGQDLPDYYIQIVTEAVEADRFAGGADAARPAVPTARDIYFSTDTQVLWICVVDGAWTGFDASILVQGILTLYANLVGGGFRITGLADPVAAQDAATRAYVLAQCALRLALAGGLMAGDIAMGANRVTGLAAPALAADAARLAEVDAVEALLDDVTQTEPARALDTVYQNDSGKIRLVTVTLDLEPDEAVRVYVEDDATPAIRVAQLWNAGNADLITMPVTFIVPPGWYYEVHDQAGAPSILEWFEWDLH